MNALNGALTRIFDLVLSPLESLGVAWALIVVSGLFVISDGVRRARVIAARREIEEPQHA